MNQPPNVPDPDGSTVAVTRQQVETLGMLVRLGWGLVAMGVSGGGWLAMLQFKLNAHDRSIAAHESDILAEKLWRADASAKAFTAYDWASNSAKLVDVLNLQERRLGKVEDSTARIEKNVEAMRTKLDAKP